uniref:Dimerisation domain-containing protein n=1 Tax=Steinernema glaseri TaxID=37863 RepID=A0A1I7ZME8_9BILA
MFAASDEDEHAGTSEMICKIGRPEGEPAIHMAFGVLIAFIADVSANACFVTSGSIRLPAICSSVEHVEREQSSVMDSSTPTPEAFRGDAELRFCYEYTHPFISRMLKLIGRKFRGGSVLPFSL